MNVLQMLGVTIGCGALAVVDLDAVELHAARAMFAREFPDDAERITRERVTLDAEYEVQS